MKLPAAAYSAKVAVPLRRPEATGFGEGNRISHQNFSLEAFSLST